MLSFFYWSTNKLVDEFESAFQRNSITVTVEDFPWQIGRGKKPMVINLESLFSDHTYTFTDSTVIHNYTNGSYSFLGKCEVTTLSVTNTKLCFSVMRKLICQAKNFVAQSRSWNPEQKKFLKCQESQLNLQNSMTWRHWSLPQLILQQPRSMAKNLWS